MYISASPRVKCIAQEGNTCIYKYVNIRCASIYRYIYSSPLVECSLQPGTLVSHALLLRFHGP